jgi:putative adhesin
LIAMTTTSTRIFGILGGLLGIALVIGGAWSLAGLMARNSFTEHASYTGVEQLVVESGGGQVKLTGVAAGSQLAVRTRVTRAFKSPERRATRSGNTLTLQSSCSGIFSDNCTVDYEIAVPSGTVVTVENGAGDVHASGLASDGAVRLSSGSGSVELSDARAAVLELHSGSGDVKASNVRAPRINATNGSGAVELDVPKAASVLTAESGSGSVVLTVPNVTYALDASSGSGDVIDDGIRTDAASPRILRARSGSGSVVISAR